MVRPRKAPEDRKIRLNTRLDPELYAWVEERIASRRFASFTHALEAGLIRLRDDEEGEGAPSRASRTTTSKK